MSSARVIFVRHTEPSEEMRDRIVGRLDPALSARGVEHAREIVAALAKEPIKAIYASPLARARETAAPLLSALGLELVVEDDLREIDFGELEGMLATEALACYPAVSEWTIAPDNASFPGGESVRSMRHRAVRAARTIADRHPDETVVVFSHAVVIRAIVADALSMAPDALFRVDQSYGGLTVIEWFDGNPFVRAVNASRI